MIKGRVRARASTDVVATAACGGAAAAGSNMRKVFLGKAFFSMHSKTFEREAQKSTCKLKIFSEPAMFCHSCTHLAL